MSLPRKNWERPSRKSQGIVTLITDFGLSGEYAGAMKGAILKVNPRCSIIDITHQIPPQDVERAAWILRNTYPFFPAGTVHLVVVDPGVGTRRRPLVIRKDGHFFVGPDNGVFTWIAAGSGKLESYQINRSEYFLSPVSGTFHGRDIFAPISGHLSLGIDPRRFGSRTEGLVEIKGSKPRQRGKELVGRILFADSFGNLITNISREEYGPLLEDQGIEIRAGRGKTGRLLRTYGEAGPGELLVLFGSAGLLEIAVNHGNAQKELGLQAGDPVTVRILSGRERK